MEWRRLSAQTAGGGSQGKGQGRSSRKIGSRKKAARTLVGSMPAPSMRWTGSDLAAKELVDAGVVLFVGTPGIQNRAMDSALERAGARPILVANEASAAFAVAGIFESSEGTEIACANLIGGPGITHALVGIAIAY